MQLRVEGVSKLYGSVRAVDALTLSVSDGEFFFLLGPSGCGKTTTLRMLAGFEIPTSGKIFFGDRDVTFLEPSRRNIGMVFQNYALWPHMTVRENVEYGLKLRKVPASERRRRVDHTLESVRMTGYGERTPNQLSGGQQQRVALARAIVIEPDVLLFDEPLSNLDAKLRLEMRAEIRRIQRDTKITTIYVTHDQKEALSMADRMAIMKSGQIAQLGNPRDVYRHPVDPFIASFVGETNFIHGTVESESGELVLVRSSLGTLKSQPSPHLSFRSGDPVTISLRPESIRLGRSAETRDNRIECEIEDRSFLGEIEQFHLSGPSGVQITATQINPDLDSSLKKITIGFDKTECVLLKRPSPV